MGQPGGKKLEITIVDSMNGWGMMGVAGKWVKMAKWGGKGPGQGMEGLFGDGRYKNVSGR